MNNLKPEIENYTPPDYKAIIDASVDAILSISAEGIISSFNQSAEEIFGYKAQEVIGHNISILMPNPYKSGHDGYLRNFHKTGVAKVIGIGQELVALKKDGTTIPIDLSVTEIKMEGSSQYAGIIRDISDRKQQERELLSSNEKYQDLYFNSPTPFLSINYLTGNIVRCNPALIDLLGYTAEELIGCRLIELYADTPDGVPKAKIAFERASAGESLYDEELQMERKDGLQIWVSHSARPILNEDGVGIESRSTLIDITQKKHLEQSLIEAQKNADAANKAKTLFLSRMSHELRTPLNAILGFAQLQKNKLAELEDEDLRITSDYIYAGGKHLLTLVEGLLDLVTIEKDDLTVELVDVSLAKIFDESLALVSTELETSRIRLTLDATNLFVKSNHQQLTQVILNLLTNAIKYNKAGGSVHITSKEHSPNQIVISIQDTGVGIDESDFDKIFENFSRLDYANKNEIQGTGIGLALAQQLVKAMHGELTVKSTLNVGSTFSLVLPKGARPESRSEQPKEIAAILNKNCTILYIEDDFASSALLQQLLAQYPSLSLITAKNAEIGIGIANKVNPDLILVDINLPGIGGIEAVQKMLQMRLLSQKRFVAISADAGQDTISKALKAGFHNYLTKPIDLYQIVDEINNTPVSPDALAGNG